MRYRDPELEDLRDQLARAEREAEKRDIRRRLRELGFPDDSDLPKRGKS